MVYQDWRCCMGLQQRDARGLTAAEAIRGAYWGGAVSAL